MNFLNYMFWRLLLQLTGGQISSNCGLMIEEIASFLALSRLWIRWKRCMNGRYVIQGVRNGIVDFVVFQPTVMQLFFGSILILPGSLKAASEIFSLMISSLLPLFRLHCCRAPALFQGGHVDIAAGWTQ